MSGQLTAASCIAALSLYCSAFAHADVITTQDGSRLVGTVKKVTPNLVEIDTKYAGALTVQMAEVTGLQTDAPLTTRLNDETTVTGVTTMSADRSFQITHETLATSAAIEDIRASWLPDAVPPPESGYDPRHWVTTVGADLTGKKGNTDQYARHVVGAMALVTHRDELKLYGAYTNDQTDNDETADETKLGASYVAHTAGFWGWYIRGEGERDTFEQINLRATGSAGLSMLAIDSPSHTLRFFTGVGYRNESYEDDRPNDSVATLDIGVYQRWELKPWLTMVNNMAIAPAVDDFDNYLFTQDSAFVIPVGTGRWSLQLGVANNYNSRPAPDKDALDTTYYTRLSVMFE